MTRCELLENDFREFAPGYYINRNGICYSTKRNKFLKYALNDKGYLRVEVYINGKRKHEFVHIKVVELFGDCNGRRIPPGATSLLGIGLSIDHLNNIRTDPRQCNLELVSHQENCRRREERATELALGF